MTVPYELDGYEVIDVRDLPEALRGYVEMFMAEREPHGIGGLGVPPWLYRTAKGSSNQCGFAMSTFLTRLIDGGYISRADLGERGRWWSEEVVRFDGIDHRAARVDEFIIDFTARQFDESAPWPLIWKSTA